MPSVSSSLVFGASCTGHFFFAVQDRPGIPAPPPPSPLRSPGETPEVATNRLIQKFMDPKRSPYFHAWDQLMLALPCTHELQETKNIFTRYDLGFNFMQAMQVPAPNPAADT